MDLRSIFIKYLNSRLNPDVEKKIITTLLYLGSVLLVAPAIVTGLVIGISGKGNNTTFLAEYNREFSIWSLVPGALLLLLALFYFERKLHRERKLSRSKPTTEQRKDKETLRRILESISSSEIDQAFSFGDSSLFYYPVIHYFYGLDAVITSSGFMLYNKRLKSIVGEFHDSFKRFVSHGASFTNTNNPDIYRLIKPHEIGDLATCKQREQDYYADLDLFHRKYGVFMGYVKNNHSDIDLEKANRIAIDEYVSHVK